MPDIRLMSRVHKILCDALNDGSIAPWKKVWLDTEELQFLIHHLAIQMEMENQNRPFTYRKEAEDERPGQS